MYSIYIYNIILIIYKYNILNINIEFRFDADMIKLAPFLHPVELHQSHWGFTRCPIKGGTWKTRNPPLLQNLIATCHEIKADVVTWKREASQLINAGSLLCFLQPRFHHQRNVGIMCYHSFSLSSYHSLNCGEAKRMGNNKEASAEAEPLI